MKQNIKIDAETVKAIESIVSKGYCAEVRPVKDGVKILQVIRQQVDQK